MLFRSVAACTGTGVVAQQFDRTCRCGPGFQTREGEAGGCECINPAHFLSFDRMRCVPHCAAEDPIAWSIEITEGPEPHCGCSADRGFFLLPGHGGVDVGHCVCTGSTLYIDITAIEPICVQECVGPGVVAGECDNERQTCECNTNAGFRRIPGSTGCECLPGRFMNS